MSCMFSILLKYSQSVPDRLERHLDPTAALQVPRLQLRQRAVSFKTGNTANGVVAILATIAGATLFL